MSDDDLKAVFAYLRSIAEHYLAARVSCERDTRTTSTSLVRFAAGSVTLKAPSANVCCSDDASCMRVTDDGRLTPRSVRTSSTGVNRSFS
jgi:hypothetical protein